MTTNTDLYRAARDQLLSTATDYDAALANFTWPRLSGRFNWATDWFDVIARDNDRPALWIVEEDGREQRVSFAEVATRSDRMATWFATLGMSQGDRVLLMLGNQVELWEAMLAVWKLGAVVMPTTTALGPDDLTDRIERGAVRFVIANAADTAKFDGVEGDYERIAVGEPESGWLRYSDADTVESAGPFESVTDLTDELLVYFTSGTTSKPKMVRHTQISYPVGGWPRAGRPTPTPHGPSRSTPATASHPICGCGGWNSTSCPRPSPGRSAGRSCGGARSRRMPRVWESTPNTATRSYCRAHDRTYDSIPVSAGFSGIASG